MHSICRLPKALTAIILATAISAVLLAGLGFYGALSTAEARTRDCTRHHPCEPETTISSWVDHDSATPIDEDGNGTEPTTVTYSVSKADGAQYALDGGAWRSAPASPFDIILNADGVQHTLSVRATRSSDGAVDSTPATATMTMCPQAGCNVTPPPPPSAPPPPPSPPPPPPSSLYFFDDFERDADTMQPPWGGGTCYGPKGGVTTDPTMHRKGSYAGKFEVYDGDCTSYPTRALVRWNQHFCEGDDRYIGYSMYVPSNLPAPSPGWMNLGQFGYGPPWGYPPLHFNNDDNGFRMSVYNQYNTRLTYVPFSRDAWTDIVLHERFSKNPSIGFVEIWVNGVPLTMANGSTRYYTNTLRDDATGCGSLDIQQYRKAGMWPSPLTVWFDEVKVGASYADVTP